MDVHRNCPTTPSFDELKPPIFTPREQLSSINPNESSAEINPNIYALNLTHITELHTPRNSLSLNEQLRLERDIAHQSTIKTRDSFAMTYSSLQTMLSQMQLKVAAAFLQETEYLQQREQRLQYEEQTIVERQKQLENIRHEQERMEEDFIQIKDRLELAVKQVTKFKTNGVIEIFSIRIYIFFQVEILQNLFSESRQIDEKLSELISESMESLVRSRSLINSKNNDFLQKSDDIRSEFNDRTTLIRHTESTITMMLELINTLNQLNIEHSQDLSIVKSDFEKKNVDFIELSQTIKHNWDIEKELEQIHFLENEKSQVQQELYEQTLLLENLKTVLGKAITPS
jgi:hypothetical protein